MADAYTYAAEHDSQEQDEAEHAKQIARCVAKFKGSSRSSQLRTLAGLLEQLPQDVEALGSSKARDVLLEALSDRSILHSKQRDVRMYAAACFTQLLRIYAPDTPYDDKQLEVGVQEQGGGALFSSGATKQAPAATGSKHKPAISSSVGCGQLQHTWLSLVTPFSCSMLQPVFELLLWSIEQVQEYQAPSYELAVSVLQTISQVGEESSQTGQWC
jgi:hypothetical protein